MPDTGLEMILPSGNWCDKSEWELPQCVGTHYDSRPCLLYFHPNSGVQVDKPDFPAPWGREISTQRNLRLVDRLAQIPLSNVPSFFLLVQPGSDDALPRATS